MSLQHEPEQVANSDLNPNEETSRLLVDATAPGNGSGNITNSPAAGISRLHKAQSYCCSTNGPASGAPGIVTQQSLSASSSSKPVLMRQERTSSSYLASPQLSTLGTSEDTSDEDRTISYQLMPSAPVTRCRSCRVERRSSVSPNSVIFLSRSASKESIGRASPNPPAHNSNSGTIPPVYVTGSPSASASVSASPSTGIANPRIIRQSSQPESSSLSTKDTSSCAHQTSSLRQLKDPSDGISGIAVDAIRVRYFCCWIYLKVYFEFQKHFLFHSHLSLD